MAITLPLFVHEKLWANMHSSMLHSNKNFSHLFLSIFPPFLHDTPSCWPGLLPMCAQRPAGESKRHSD